MSTEVYLTEDELSTIGVALERCAEDIEQRITELTEKSLPSSHHDYEFSRARHLAVTVDFLRRAATRNGGSLLILVPGISEEVEPRDD